MLLPSHVPHVWKTAAPVSCRFHLYMMNTEIKCMCGNNVEAVPGKKKKRNDDVFQLLLHLHSDSVLN